MGKFILANGIRTHGEGNIDILGRHLVRLGHEVLDPRLPRRDVITARWGAKSDAKILAGVAEAGDVLLGHSFGGLRALKTAELVPDLKAIVLYGAAVARRYDTSAIADTIEIINVHNPYDAVLKLGSFLLFHPFGLGGRDGLTSPRVVNFCQPFDGPFSASHNSYFDSHLEQSADVAVNALEETL